MGALDTAFPAVTVLRRTPPSFLAIRFACPPLPASRRREGGGLHPGSTRLLYCMGGNFFAPLPDPDTPAGYVRRAAPRHQDISSPTKLIDRGGGNVRSGPTR